MRTGNLWLKSAFIVLAMVLGLAALMSCAKATPTTTTAKATPTATTAQATSTTTTAQATPATPTGTLTVALNTLREETWLPNTGAEQRALYQTPVLETLVQVKWDTRELIPGLATSWTASADAKTWTFNLRKGVQFHDGWGEMTADDVKFSYELVTRKGTLAGRGAALAPAIDRVEVVNPYQIVFHLNKPTATLDVELSNFTMTLVVHSKKYVESVGEQAADRHPIGTGPYKWVEQTIGDHITLVAVDGGNWRLVPEFKNLVFRKIPEELTRITMVKTGAADLANMSQDGIAEAKKAGARVLTKEGAYDAFAVMNGQFLTSDPKYDPKVAYTDINVRQALNLAINRQEISNTLFGGLAKPNAFWQATPGNNKYAPYPFDPVKAKKLLADAGYGAAGSLKLRLVQAPSGPGSSMNPSLIGALAQYWSAVGIDAKIEPMDYTAWRLILSAKDGGKQNSLHVLTRPLDLDWETAMRGFLYSPTPVHPAFQDSRLDLLIDKLGVTIGAAQRAQVVEEIGKFLYDQYAVIPLVSADAPWVASAKVGELRMLKGGYDGYFELTTQAKK